MSSPAPKRPRTEAATVGKAEESFSSFRSSTVRASDDEEVGDDKGEDVDDDGSESLGDEDTETEDEEDEKEVPQPQPSNNQAVGSGASDNDEKVVKYHLDGGYGGISKYHLTDEDKKWKLEAPNVKITSLRLKAAQEYSDAEYGDFDFGQFDREYAKLPRLTHLWLWGVGGISIDDGGHYEEIPFREAKKLQHLKVTTSNVGSSCLAYIISFSDRCLKSFAYQCGGLHSGDGSSGVIYPGDIWAMLDGTSATLEKLDIDFDSQSQGGRYWGDWEDDESNVSAAIARVRRRTRKGGRRFEFPNLKCLRIGIEALMGLITPPGSEKLRIIDWLPEDLEELTIRGYDANVASEHYIEQIEELLDELPTRSPNLMTVEGIDECIPNGQNGDDRDYDDDIDEESVAWSDNSDGF